MLGEQYADFRRNPIKLIKGKTDIILWWNMYRYGASKPKAEKNDSLKQQNIIFLFTGILGLFRERQEALKKGELWILVAGKKCFSWLCRVKGQTCSLC